MPAGMVLTTRSQPIFAYVSLSRISRARSERNIPPIIFIQSDQKKAKRTSAVARCVRTTNETNSEFERSIFQPKRLGTRTA